MQYPVPQFTDVEDKIIGNLTFRQFGIILATGGLIFFVYSITKDFIITGFAGLVLGIPGLLLAFMQFNGRPLYRNIPLVIKHFTGQKVLIFRKQSTLTQSVMLGEIKLDSKLTNKNSLDEDPRTRLKKIEYQLEQRAKEEEEILGK